MCEHAEIMLFLLSDFLVDSLFLRKVMKPKSPNSVTTFMSGQCCVRGSEGDPRLILAWDCSDRPVSRGGGALASHQCSDHRCTLGICRDGGGLDILGGPLLFTDNFKIKSPATQHLQHKISTKCRQPENYAEFLAIPS